MISKKHSRHSFPIYLLGQTLSSLGDGVYVIAFMWLSLKLSGGKGIVLGGIFSVYTLGELIFGFLSGPVVDRFNKKQILVLMDLARGSILCILYVTIVLGKISLMHLYIYTFLFAILSPVFHRAEYAILPEIIPKSRLLKANGLLSGLKRVMRVISTAVGGVIIHLFGIEACFLFDGLSFFSSVLCITLVHINTARHAKQSRKIHSMISDVRRGSSIVLRSTFFLTLSLYAACINFVGAPVFPLLPIVSEHVSIGASGYGIMISALSAGLITASLLICCFERILPKIKIMLLGICVSSFGVIGTAFGRSFLSITPACFLIGVGLSLANLPIQTIFQERIPSRNLGVVSGFVFTIAQLAMPISMALSGFIIQYISVNAVFIIIGVLMFIGVIIGLFLPQLK